MHKNEICLISHIFCWMFSFLSMNMCGCEEKYMYLDLCVIVNIQFINGKPTELSPITFCVRKKTTFYGSYKCLQFNGFKKSFLN